MKRVCFDMMYYISNNEASRNILKIFLKDVKQKSVKVYIKFKISQSDIELQ